MADPFGLGERADSLAVKLDAIETAILSLPRGEQKHSPQLREWEPFVLVDGGTTSAAGAVTIGGAGSNLIPAPVGWEAYVDRVSVTVQGASQAARVDNYRGTVADQNLFDQASALFGNTPSRTVADYSTPVYFVNGVACSIAVTGAVASQPVVVRVEGRRRQV